MGSTRTAVLLVGVAVATVGVYAAMFSLDTTKDRPDTLDVQPVKGVAAAACTRLHTTLDPLPRLAAAAPLQARLDRLAVQDAAVRALVTQVREVGEPALRKDVPAEQWLSDWTTLADVRRAYAAGGATGVFVSPSADGHALTERMGAVGISACKVPDALSAAP